MTHPTNFHSGFHSLFQSAVRKVLGDRGEHEQGLGAGHPMAQAAAGVLEAHLEGGKLEGKAGTLEVCARLALELAEAKLAGNEGRVEELESELKDSDCDPGWAEAVAIFLEYYALHRAPMYRDEGIPAYALPEGRDSEVLTVGLLGDWGTGAPEADTVLSTMVEKFDPDLILHVGDVYYAGTKDENRENYLRALNEVRRKRPIPVYGVPGNHDYYDGGSGFYEVQIAEVNKEGFAPPGTPIQTASYFCLQNDGWQLQGMDTGYHDHDLFKVSQDYTRLRSSESAWHKGMIDAAGDRKVLLFSHHQLFSAFANIGTQKKGTQTEGNYNQTLLEVFRPYIDAGKITAWFWGHEHLLEIYDPYKGLDKGRCVGHSAFPVLAVDDAYEVKYPQVPLTPSPDVGQDFIQLGVSDEVYNHGFVVLELRTDQTGKAKYYEMAGDDSSDACWLIHSEEL